MATFPVLAGVGLFLAGVFRWRDAVVAALMLAVFEGALRKWVFPEHGQAIYFAKDMLLLGAYAGFGWVQIRRGQRLVARHPANALLALLCVLALVELANPTLPSFLVGLFGLKAYLLYVPLLYIVPSIFSDGKSLRKLWLALLIMSVVPMTLGILQFSSPVDSVLNRYAWEDDRAPGAGVAIFSSGNKVRVTGTFSYVTGYSVYLVTLVLMALPLAIEERGRVRLMIVGVLAMTILNLMMTGSRGAVLLVVLVTPALLFVSLRYGALWKLPQVVALCVELLLVGILLRDVFAEPAEAFFARATEGEGVYERALEILSGPVMAFDEAGFLGFGIGTTHQVAALLPSQGGGQGLPPPAEGEWGRIVLEIGVVGFALVLLTRVLVARSLLTALKVGHSELRPFLVSALFLCVLSVPGDLVFNHTASIFYWFFAGLALIEAPYRRNLSSARPELGPRIRRLKRKEQPSPR